MVENAGEAIVVAQDGMIVYLNPRALTISGHSKREALFRPFINLVHPDDRKMVMERHQRRLRGEEKSTPYELRIIDKDGKVKWLSNTGAIVEWEGRPATLNCLADITQHKMEEHRRQRAYEIQSALSGLLRACLEAATLEESLERSLDHLVSIPWLALESRGAILLAEDGSQTLVLTASRGMPAAMRRRCGRIPFGKCWCGRAAESGDIQFSDQASEDRDHRYRGLFAHGGYSVPIKSSDGQVLGVINLPLKEGHRRDEVEERFLGAVADTVAGMIQRKRAEGALRESEHRYRTLFENSIEGIAISKGNRFVAANQALIKMFGYQTLEEFTSIPLIEHIAPRDRKMILDRMKKRQRKKQVADRLEVAVMGKDGKSRDLEVLTVEVLIDGERCILGTSRDITGRKRTEKKLKQTARELRLEREALERKNIALREILTQIDSEKDALERRVATNVQQAIIPTLRKVKRRSPPSLKRILNLLENDLREIASPFLDSVKGKYTKLTSRELEVCRFIRDGMTSKEIAEALHLSLFTVYKHREVIRRKLGLVNEGSNLRTFLQSL